jgi:hypothetical protein
VFVVHLVETSDVRLMTTLCQQANRFSADMSDTKMLISLVLGQILGDPTTFGNLQPADQVLEAMKDVIDQGNYNGMNAKYCQMPI